MNICVMLLSSFLLVFPKARNFADLEFCQIFRNPYEKFPGLKKKISGDFPVGPVMKTHSQCKAPGFHPWSGN